MHYAYLRHRVQHDFRRVGPGEGTGVGLWAGTDTIYAAWMHVIL